MDNTLLVSTLLNFAYIQVCMIEEAIQPPLDATVVQYVTVS